MLSDDNSHSYQNEIDNALQFDSQRIGDVFRAMQEGAREDAPSIANDLGLGLGPVSSALTSIRTLREGKRVVNGTTYAAQKASMLRNFERRHAANLSSETRRRLLDLATEHDKFARDKDEISRENEEIERASEAVSDGKETTVPGIYVYTYPHYMRYPVLSTDDDDTTNPRTYLKVGMSDRDMRDRIAEQTSRSTTSMPEPPLILRMYTTNNDVSSVGEVEKRLHDHLNAADHGQFRQGRAGKEWFLTHLQFLDSAADLLGLETHYANPDY